MRHIFSLISSACLLLTFNIVQAQEVKINHDGTNGLVIESDGTLVSEGDATVWRDEVQTLMGKKLYDGAARGDIKYDLQEFTVYFETDADMTSAVVMNIQLNHDWDGITPVEPHLHWFQNQNNTPNWLIGYRWHQNGQPKVDTWTYEDYTGNAFTYDSGTILQISSFPSITPPATPTGVSSILQLKLIRDTNNDSSKFTGNDPYSGNAHGLSFDIHVKINTMGSRTEYAK